MPYLICLMEFFQLEYFQCIMFLKRSGTTEDGTKVSRHELDGLVMKN